MRAVNRTIQRSPRFVGIQVEEDGADDGGPLRDGNCLCSTGDALVKIRGARMMIGWRHKDRVPAGPCGLSHNFL